MSDRWLGESIWLDMECERTGSGWWCNSWAGDTCCRLAPLGECCWWASWWWWCWCRCWW